MICSGLIIFEVLRDKVKRNKVYHRLLLAMSISDLNTSFWYTLSTWPIPSETSNVYAPLGTRGSCVAQGFFVQLGIATPIFNAMLSIYYLLIIRYGWKEKDIKKVEKVFYFIPIVFALVTAFSALGLELLNNANLWCWIAPYPLSCKGSYRNNGINDCERGNNAWIFRWAFFYAPLWFIIIISMIAMFLTYFSVRKTELQSVKWTKSIKLQKAQALRHSKQVLKQAFFYLMAFYFSWLAATLTRLIQTINGKSYFPLILLFAITTPLQGGFNFIVYIRPKYLKYRKEHPDSICAVMCKICFPYRGGDNAETSFATNFFSSMRSFRTRSSSRSFHINPSSNPSANPSADDRDEEENGDKNVLSARDEWKDEAEEECKKEEENGPEATQKRRVSFMGDGDATMTRSSSGVNQSIS